MQPWTAIEARGGLARRWQLIDDGVDPDRLDLAAWYGQTVIRVRKGWYALADEHPEVLRAWRVGGRLTCVSAVAFRTGETAGPVLHVEVPANSPRLRDPDLRRRPLAPGAAVVVHWPRRPGQGDTRAVELDHAERVAAVCGVYAAASRASASRIV